MRIAGQSVADNPGGRDRDHHAGRTDGKHGPEAEGDAASEMAKGPNNPAIVDEKENTIVEGTNVVDRRSRARHTLRHTNSIHVDATARRAPRRAGQSSVSVKKFLCSRCPSAASQHVRQRINYAGRTVKRL